MGAAGRAENQWLLLKEPFKKSLKRLRHQCHECLQYSMAEAGSLKGELK